jgi:hypothetical protein
MTCLPLADTWKLPSDFPIEFNVIVSETVVQTPVSNLKLPRPIESPYVGLQNVRGAIWPNINKNHITVCRRLIWWCIDIELSCSACSKLKINPKNFFTMNRAEKQFNAAAPPEHPSFPPNRSYTSMCYHKAQAISRL